MGETHYQHLKSWPALKWRRPDLTHHYSGISEAEALNDDFLSAMGDICKG